MKEKNELPGDMRVTAAAVTVDAQRLFHEIKGMLEAGGVDFSDPKIADATDKTRIAIGLTSENN